MFTVFSCLSYPLSYTEDNSMPCGCSKFSLRRYHRIFPKEYRPNVDACSTHRTWFPFVRRKSPMTKIQREKSTNEVFFKFSLKERFMDAAFPLIHVRHLFDLLPHPHYIINFAIHVFSMPPNFLSTHARGNPYTSSRSSPHVKSYAVSTSMSDGAG